MNNIGKNTPINLDHEVNSHVTHEEREYYKYKTFWRAVIMQAILDLVNNSARTEERMARESAHSWIFGFSNDFLVVCAMAEYSPSKIRKHAKKVIKDYNVKNKKWKILLRSGGRQ